MEFRGIDGILNALGAMDMKTLLIIGAFVLVAIVLIFILKKIFALIFLVVAIFAVTYFFPVYYGTFSFLSILLIGVILLAFILKLVLKRKK